VLGVFVFFGLLALEIEALSGVALFRRRELAKLWPEVIDSIHSAVTSGMSLLDALDELSERGPLRTRVHFERLSTRVDKGWSLVDSLNEFKAELGDVHADRLCELLMMVSSTGAESLANTLRSQATSLRLDIARSALIETKQGWVLGTAKIAVSAPWIVVALLSVRQENSAIYNTADGAAILLVGFLVCMFAYRLVHVFGALPQQPRVFAS
jgi:tight adherence protein B